MAKRFTRSSKMLNLCKINTHFFDKTTSSTSIKRRETDTDEQNKWANSDSKRKVEFWLQNHVNNNMAVIEKDVLNEKENDGISSIPENTTKQNDCTDVENIQSCLLLKSKKGENNADTLSGNGGIFNMPENTTNQNDCTDVENTKSCLLLNTKLDKDNLDTLSGCSSSFSEYDDDDKDKDWTVNKKQWLLPISSESTNNNMLRDLDVMDETVDVSNQLDASINEVVKINRKKKANPEKWKKNINRLKRLRGEDYTNSSGKLIPKKEPKFVNCTKCRYKCNKNFSEDVRKKICFDYWGLGDNSKQKMYLASCVSNVPVRRRRPNSTNHKSVSRQIFLRYGEEQKRVCLKFLCATLSISHRVLEVCMRGVLESGIYMGQHKNKGRKPSNSTKTSDVELAKDHIDSFPRVESHYCRKDTKKHYLSSDLNISTMYRLYKDDFCTAKQIQPISLVVYRKIFHDYSPELSFFKPKKDQCPLCNAYALNKETLANDYKEHKQRENDSMEMKKLDKQNAILDNGKTFRAITFDLQAILSVPYAGDSQLYYKRKLNIYNFTIFDAFNKNGFCYVWDECSGKKGSIEIGTCLLKYLFELPTTVHHVSSFSDTCGGQNRNKNVCAAMLYAVNKITHLQTVDLKYMESGHSYLEADAMHATIERFRKHKKIYTTREWALLISSARLNPSPYNVNCLNYSSFYDLNSLASTVMKNTTKRIVNNSQAEESKNVDEKVQWLKIKWLRFEKSKPNIIQYKYNLYDTDFYEIDITQCNKRKVQCNDWANIELKPAYTKQIPISDAKKTDLLYLLEKRIIPPDYKHFIESIPSTNRPKGNSSDCE